MGRYAKLSIDPKRELRSDCLLLADHWGLMQGPLGWDIRLLRHRTHDLYGEEALRELIAAVRTRKHGASKRVPLFSATRADTRFKCQTS